jgi:LysR family transcriptional regulator (chromosome initiation inhibitor)
MIDYKLLEALATVVETGGFERAGATLSITQSAVSQRIKTLEIRLGQPVLLRGPAIAPTPAGRKLLNHVQQVQLLERDLAKSLPTLSERTARLRIAVNADSLATWWAETVGELSTHEGLLFDIVIEDQDVGLRRMRDGDVAACLCSSDQPVAGARCVAIGTMRYLPLATPQYTGRFFSKGLTKTSLQKAPAIVFGPNDQLQHRFPCQLRIPWQFPLSPVPLFRGIREIRTCGHGLWHDSRDTGTRPDIIRPSPEYHPRAFT